MATIKTGEQPNRKTKEIYDPANGVNADGDVDTSLIANNPTHLSIEGMDPALTSVTVQGKLDPAGVWHDMVDVDVSTPNAMIIFNPEDSPNFVRVVRVGAQDFRAVSQRNRED